MSGYGGRSFGEGRSESSRPRRDSFCSSREHRGGCRASNTIDGPGPRRTSEKVWRLTHTVPVCGSHKPLRGRGGDQRRHTTGLSHCSRDSKLLDHGFYFRAQPVDNFRSGRSAKCRSTAPSTPQPLTAKRRKRGHTLCLGGWDPHRSLGLIGVAFRRHAFQSRSRLAGPCDRTVCRLQLGSGFRRQVRTLAGEGRELVPVFGRARAHHIHQKQVCLGGPSVCGTERPFELSAVDEGRISLKPPAMLRCPMIPQVERWIRESVAPSARYYLGSDLVEISVAASYSCRPMNNVSGAKLSEHGYANALDVSGFTLASGRKVTLKRGWKRRRRRTGFSPRDPSRRLRAVHDGAQPRP